MLCEFKPIEIRTDLRTDLITARINSLEWGLTTLRHKIYYEDADDLSRRIQIALAGERFLLEQQAQAKNKEAKA